MSTNGAHPLSPLVEVDSLVVEFTVAAREWRSRAQALRAVDGVSFTIDRGETLGLVGESGSGKTTIGRAIVRLNTVKSGHIRFEGSDLSLLEGAALRSWRKRAQIVFQDPYASLNPRMKVEEIIGEPLRARGARKETRRQRVQELLESVGLPPSAGGRYPNSFSGGQRQRISIARALALEPDFLVADEVVSALDVSVQAQIVNLLSDLQEDLGLTVLFIAHDLAVVRQIATRVAVMYLGKIVELGKRDEIFARPLHPPTGCRFHTRCPYVMPVCKEIEPAFRAVSGRFVACHLVSAPETVGSAEIRSQRDAE